MIKVNGKEGFIVMPYMYPDLNVARDLVSAGAACIMPLASPIGSNKGLCAKDFIKILVDEIDIPIIVDAGIGRPSQACEAMEMGVAAVMANTAIAAATFLEEMAQLAQEETRKHFGNSIYMFTPLYIANYCENYCIYCGFNCHNKIRRAKLNPEEIEKEMHAYLLQRKYPHAEIADGRSVEEVYQAIKDHGLQPVMNDYVYV